MPYAVQIFGFSQNETVLG